jgi:hypothetical protein
MISTCKNCNNRYKGNFCNNCGQTANTHDISFHYVWHDIQHGLFHFDNKLFYTIKSLILRPGYTIKDFINGKRVKHFGPISFVIFLATLYGLLKHLIEIPSFKLDVEEETSYGLRVIINWFGSHYALTRILFLLLTSLSTFLVFKRQKYNFLQHFVLNSYLNGLIFVFNIALIPFVWVVGRDHWIIISIISVILRAIYTFWTLFQVFDNLPKAGMLVRIILAFILRGILYLAFGFFIVMVAADVVEKIIH